MNTLVMVIALGCLVWIGAWTWITGQRSRRDELEFQIKHNRLMREIRRHEDA